jgi:putative membrane protein (TIGR04086 family)
MQGQSVEQKEQNGKEKKKIPVGWIFAGVVLLALLMAAGLFLLWAWASYHLRFSAEVIRIGLLSLYIFPCLFGGKILGRTRLAKPMLWGAGLGICFYGVLFGASLLAASAAESALPEPDMTAVLPLFLSVFSGMAGSIRHKKREANP